MMLEAASALAGRHIVENALAQYCSAMDHRDATTAATLLSNATLFFKDQPSMHGAAAIEVFYRAAFTAGADRTAHMIGNLEVGADDDAISYNCLYQRASIDSDGLPKLVGIGCYRGRFTFDSARFTWQEHRVASL